MSNIQLGNGEHDRESKHNNNKEAEESGEEPKDNDKKTKDNDEAGRDCVLAQSHDFPRLFQQSLLRHKRASAWKEKTLIAEW